MFTYLILSIAETNTVCSQFITLEMFNKNKMFKGIIISVTRSRHDVTNFVQKLFIKLLWKYFTFSDGFQESYTQEFEAT